jgi:hypothetical protein
MEDNRLVRGVTRLDTKWEKQFWKTINEMEGYDQERRPNGWKELESLTEKRKISMFVI